MQTSIILPHSKRRSRQQPSRHDSYNWVEDSTFSPHPGLLTRAAASGQHSSLGCRRYPRRPGMSDSPDDTKKGATEINAGANRRDFIKSAAAAGLVGAAGLTPALGQSTAAAPQGGAQDPQAPPGLAPNALLDARFPLTYENSVPEGVKVLTAYFAALSRRDLRQMADTLHFPSAGYKEPNPVLFRPRTNSWLMRQPL